MNVSSIWRKTDDIPDWMRRKLSTRQILRRLRGHKSLGGNISRTFGNSRRHDDSFQRPWPCDSLHSFNQDKTEIMAMWAESLTNFDQFTMRISGGTDFRQLNDFIPIVMLSPSCMIEFDLPVPSLVTVSLPVIRRLPTLVEHEVIKGVLTGRVTNHHSPMRSECRNQIRPVKTHVLRVTLNNESMNSYELNGARRIGYYRLRGVFEDRLNRRGINVEECRQSFTGGNQWVYFLVRHGWKSKDWSGGWTEYLSWFMTELNRVKLLLRLGSHVSFCKEVKLQLKSELISLKNGD